MPTVPVSPGNTSTLDPGTDSSRLTSATRRVDPGDDLLRVQPHLSDMSLAVLALGEGSVPRFGMALDVPLLCAVMLRETIAGWAPGYYPQGDPDGYGDDPDGEKGPKAPHGRGLFQIDTRGPFKKHIPPAGTPWSVLDQAKAALDALRAGRAELRVFRGHPLFERAVVASYNAGSPRVATALRSGNDPDIVTTPGPSRRPDYGSDVLARRARLIARYTGVFPPPRRVAG